MLKPALVFLVISIMVGCFGVSAAAAKIAKILFFVAVAVVHSALRAAGRAAVSTLPAS